MCEILTTSSREYKHINHAMSMLSMQCEVNAVYPLSIHAIVVDLDIHPADLVKNFVYIQHKRILSIRYIYCPQCNVMILA